MAFWPTPVPHKTGIKERSFFTGTFVPRTPKFPPFSPTTYQFLVSDYKQKYLCIPDRLRITLNPWSFCLCVPGLGSQGNVSAADLVWFFFVVVVWMNFTSFCQNYFRFLFVFVPFDWFFVLVSAGIKPRPHTRWTTLAQIPWSELACPWC